MTSTYGANMLSLPRLVNASHTTASVSTSGRLCPCVRVPYSISIDLPNRLTNGISYLGLNKTTYAKTNTKTSVLGCGAGRHVRLFPCVHLHGEEAQHGMQEALQNAYSHGASVQPRALNARASSYIHSGSVSASGDLRTPSIISNGSVRVNLNSAAPSPPEGGRRRYRKYRARCIPSPNVNGSLTEARLVHNERASCSDGEVSDI